MLKSLFFITTFVILMSYVFAQAPKSFKYQALVRNSSGQIIQNQNVSFQISILEGSATGTSVYEETHNVQTNEFGVVNLNIGEGTVANGNFNNISWGSNSYFIQTAFDEQGGTNYQLMGVSQLLSVPYALYSEKSGSADSSIWKTNANSIYYNQGNVGIGSITPTGKLVVKSDSTALNDDVIFSVLNAQGDTVLAVYQEGVRINVYDAPALSGSGSKGGFAVGGFSPAKGTLTNEYFRVTPDSVRVYIEENSAAKANGSKGGFAVGGFSPAKAGLTNEYLRVTNDSTRIWTEDTIAGFGVRNIGANSITSYMHLTPNNYFIGHESGLSIQDGVYNSFMGYRSGKNTTYGSKNTFLGFQSGINNDFGNNNVFVGLNSGYSNVDGYENSFIGSESGYSNNNGYGNTFLGAFSGHSNIDGNINTFIGYKSGYNNTTGNNNTFIGSNTGTSNISGSSNTFVGYESGLNNTIGSYNLFFGWQSGYNTTSGDNNTFIGSLSGFNNTSGYNNVSVGPSTAFNITTGNDNTFVGLLAGTNTTSGSYNSFFGSLAGGNNTTSQGNSFFGDRCGYYNNTGNLNSFYGSSTGFSNVDGYENCFFGYHAGYSNLSGTDNVYIGSNAGFSNTGSNNVCLGSWAGFNNSGSDNVFLGRLAGMNEAGSGKLYISNQNKNLIYGDFNSGYIGLNTNNPTGYLQVDAQASNAVVLNRVSASTSKSEIIYSQNGTAKWTIGNDLAQNNSSNFFIWDCTAASLRFIIDQFGNLGLSRYASANRLEVEGDASKTTAGSWLANSDKRIKTEIMDIENPFETILKLHPVKFKYTNDWRQKHPGIEDKFYYNFIAQEYQTVFPESVKGSGEFLENDSKEILQIDSYNAQIVTIKAIQELILQNKKLLNDVTELKKENSELKLKTQEIEKLKAEVTKINSTLELTGGK